ncbi:MAG: hypothetical protein HYY40_02250 [Bacteroidetes bacterium]|nr:hypothetical protein [Bacteroidota bacterium]
MEAIIRTNDNNLFHVLLELFKSLPVAVETEDERSKKSFADYKKNILSVSVWTDKDIELMESNLKKFNAWKIEKW